MLRLAVLAIVPLAVAFVPHLPSHALRRATATATARSAVVDSDEIVELASDGTFATVFVAGATSGVGKLCVERLLAQGKKVVALARSEEGALALEAMGATVARGDATDMAVIEPALDGCDACITTMGGTNPDGSRSDYKANAAVIEAAGIYGVSRIVLVTSIGCGDSKDALPEAAYATLEGALVEKNKAEKMLSRYYTNSLWTIIRPGGLSDDAPSGKALLTEDRAAIGAVTRADVADLVVAQLDSTATDKKILACVDPSRRPDGPSYEALAF